MSGETIKDVVIRVSIQAGNMNLDTSGLKNQVASAVSDVQAQLQSATSAGVVIHPAAAPMIPATPASSFPQAIPAAVSQRSHRELLEAQRQEEERQNEYFARPGSKAHAEKLKQQADAAQQKAHAERAADTSRINFLPVKPKEVTEQPAAVTTPKTDLSKELAEIKKFTAEKKAEFEAIKNGSSEVSQATQEQEQQTLRAAAANDIYANSMRGAVVGAAEFAKGLVFIAASSDEADQAMMKNLVTAQGYFNVIRGGVTTVSSLAAALRARAALGNVAASNAAGGGAIAGSAAPTINGAAIGAVTNPLTALAAAATATAIALRQLNVWSIQFAQEQRELATTLRQIQLDAANQAVLRHADQGLRLNAALPNVRALGQEAVNQQGRRANERDIRLKQDLTEMGFGRQQEIRGRMERSQGLKEQLANAENEAAHLEEQKTHIAEERAKFEEDRRKSEEAFNAARASVIGEFKPVPELPQNQVQQRNEEASVTDPWTGRTSQPTQPGMFPTAGDGSILSHFFTGEETKSTIEADNERARNKLQGLEAGRAGQVAAENEKNVELAARQQQLEAQGVKTASEKLNILRETAIQARKNLEIDQETIRAANQNVGMRTPGERTVLAMLEEKRKRMIQPGNKEELNQHDLEVGASAPEGSMLKAFIRDAATKKGQGVLEMFPDLNKGKEEAVAAEKNLNNNEQKLIAQIKEDSEKSQKGQEDLIKAIKESFKTEELFAALKMTFQQQTELMEKKIKTLAFWIK